MVETLINGNWKIVLPAHRAERTEYHSKKGWERERLDSMHEHIGKGDVVYYVGTELGEMAALCQIWGAEVVNFEPNSSAWPTIKRIWDANELSKPLANFAGFASNKHQPKPPKADKALFKGMGWRNNREGWPNFVDGDVIEAHGFSELYQEGDGLPQYKIDTLVEEGLKPPTVLTMDVEGSECQVLWGSEKTIVKYKPIIWMSWHPEFQFHQFNVYTRDMRNWIIDRGYREEYLAYDHEIHMVYFPI